MKKLKIYMKKVLNLIHNKYELFKIAQSKGYYIPAQKATVTEINTVKTELQ